MNQIMQPTHCLQFQGSKRRFIMQTLLLHIFYLPYFPTKHSCNHLIKLHVQWKPRKIFIFSGSNKQDIIIIILLKQTINLINIRFFYIIM